MTVGKAMMAVITGVADIRGDNVVFHTPQGDVIVPIIKLHDEEYLKKVNIAG